MERFIFDRIVTINIAFPEDVYADVRLEHINKTTIQYRDGALQDVQRKTEKGALLRVLKNGRWYYTSTTRLDSIDSQLQELAALNALQSIENSNIADGFEVNQVSCRNFGEQRINEVPIAEKLSFLRSFVDLLEEPKISSWRAFWVDNYSERQFFSSKGAKDARDYQECGLIITFSVAHEEEVLNEFIKLGAHHLSELQEKKDDLIDKIKSHLQKAIRFVTNAQKV